MRIVGRIQVLRRSLQRIATTIPRSAAYVVYVVQVFKLPTRRVIRGSPAKVSGLATKRAPPRLAGYPPLLAASSGGHGANVSGGTLIILPEFVGSGGDNLA